MKGGEEGRRERGTQNDVSVVRPSSKCLDCTWMSGKTFHTGKREEIKQDLCLASKRFELVIVNLAYIQVHFLSSSIVAKEFCDHLLNNKLPDLSFQVVDVRDVAATHITAMEKSEAAGNQQILNNCTLHITEVAKIIRDELEPQG